MTADLAARKLRERRDKKARSKKRNESPEKESKGQRDCTSGEGDGGASTGVSAF